MYLMNLMNKKCMTRADLSMMSGVPDSTLRDILSGKAQIDHCEAATIYGIADALGTTVEDVLDHYWDECLGADDEECEREVLHDGHTLLLFYSTVDRVVQLRQAVEDASLFSRPASTVKLLLICSLTKGFIGKRSSCWVLPIT